MLCESIVILLDIYPNPFIDEINYYYNGSDTNAKIVVYDLHGKEVSNGPVYHGNNTLSLKSINGNYFVLILTDSKGRYSQKLIKNK